jgi:hypothetical protein
MILQIMKGKATTHRDDTSVLNVENSRGARNGYKYKHKARNAVH